MQIHWRARYPGPRRFYPERRRAREYLDQPDVDPADKRASHLDLATVARLPAQLGPLRRFVLELAARHRGQAPSRPLRLLELGAGSGVVGLKLAGALAQAGHEVELSPTDIAPEHLPAASAQGRLRILPRRLDALRDPLPEVDIAVANLLIHHFDEDEAETLLARMHAAGRLGGAVFDLDRNRWAFTFLRFFFPLWARSPISPADALISVQQAFRPHELRELARKAGIPSPGVRRFLMIRTLLSWEREH